MVATQTKPKKKHRGATAGRKPPGARVARPLYLCEDFGPALAANGRDMARVEEMLAQGVVEDVKLQGLISANNRVYLEEGLDPQVYAETPLGAQMPCNLNHPQFDPSNQAEVKRAIVKSRPVENVFGTFEGIYKVPGKGMFAKKFRFNKKHAFAPVFEEWVRTNPSAIGFSPAQFVDSYHDGEKEVVERVVGVYGIDLVGQGATTRGLLEAMGYGDDDKKPSGVCEDDEGDDKPAMEDEETPPETELDDEGGELDDIDDEDDVDAENEEPAKAAGGPDITEEMLSALTKVIQAKLAGDLDDKAAIVKIKALFNTHSAVSEAVMAVIETNPAAFLRKHRDPAVRMAGKAVIAERDSLKGDKAKSDKRAKVTGLIEARNFDPAMVTELGLVEELMDCPDEAAMGRRLTWFAKLPGVTKKRSRPTSAHQQAAGGNGKPVTEGAGDGGGEVTDEQMEANLAKMANAVVGAAELN